jgi:hypothetical protein
MNWSVTRPHYTGRYPDWETVLEVKRLENAVVAEHHYYFVNHSDAETVLDAWSASEMPSPILADWIEENATDANDRALPHLLAALRAK